MQLSSRFIGELIVPGFRCPSVKIFKGFLKLEADSFPISHIASIGVRNQNFVCGSSQIRMLVAMAIDV